MAFQLRQKAQGKLLTAYHILNSSTGDVVGSANIPNAEVQTFLGCWKGPTVQPQPQTSAATGRTNDTNAFVAALIKNRVPMSKAALLRS